MKDKGPRIKLLILENAPNEKDLTQMARLWFSCQVKMVLANLVKVPKGWVAYGSRLRTA